MQQIDAIKRHKRIKMYGRVFHDASILDIFFQAYRWRYTMEQGGLGAEQHFKNIVSVLWPDYVWLSSDPDLPEHAHWNDRMLRAAINYQYVGVTGSKNSAKSEFFAIWALVNWLVRFTTCLVLVTSTHKGDAKKRIWASIKERYQKLPALPGKYNETLSMILANDGVSPELSHLSDRSSIALIAPDAGREGEAIGKIIGLKQTWVFVVADELTDMSPAIINACSNLNGNPNFHFVGIGNANSTLDPHGRFLEPRDGWGSISVESEQWETEMGVALHLDGLKTPNRYTDPLDKYKWLTRLETIAQDKKNLGESSARFYRFDRGFWCPQGSEDNLFAELELAQNECYTHPTWQSETTGIAFLDPAYKTGGDNCEAAFSKLGLTNRGIRVLDFEENGVFAIKEDITKDDQSVTKQRATLFVEECRKRRISVRQVGVDCTGGGSLLADAVEDAFGERGVLRVEFGGSPSDLVVEYQEDRQSGRNVEVTAKEKYENKATELWHIARKFVPNKQLTGITSKMAEQMTQRRTISKGRKIALESKKDFKLRTGKRSPDDADAGLGCLEVARQRFGFVPSDTPLKRVSSESVRRTADRFRGAYAGPKKAREMAFGRSVR